MSLKNRLYCEYLLLSAFFIQLINGQDPLAERSGQYIFTFPPSGENYVVKSEESLFPTLAEYSQQPKISFAPPGTDQEGTSDQEGENAPPPRKPGIIGNRPILSQLPPVPPPPKAPPPPPPPPVPSKLVRPTPPQGYIIMGSPPIDLPPPPPPPPKPHLLTHSKKPDKSPDSKRPPPPPPPSKRPASAPAPEYGPPINTYPSTPSLTESAPSSISQQQQLPLYSISRFAILPASFNMSNFPHRTSENPEPDDTLYDTVGEYYFSYETPEGSKRIEQGSHPRYEDGIRSLLVEGSYSYTSPEGKPVQIYYKADRLGYQPENNITLP